MNNINQIVTLHDGRRLGFDEYGDPKGKPLVYLHGWPASRLSAAIYNTLARKLHVRIIAPDRPGFGLSDFQKNRTLLDLPDDIIALADHLKIKKFAVMGVSGGGPYAAACAYKIPKRLTNLGIVVGLGPIHGLQSLMGMLWIGKIGWMTYGKYPWIRKSSTYLQYLNAKYGLFHGIDFYSWGKVDRKLLVGSDMGDHIMATIHEGFRSGYQGPELDLKLYTNDWGFELKGIRSNVMLWYGEKDQNVSPAMGRQYADSILNSKLTIYPGEGHLISITHAEEILKALIS